jgi:hypothetical protein
LIGLLLHLDLLLLGAAQRSGVIRLGAQPLDRGSHLRLIGNHSLPNCRIVVDIFRHHLEHVRETEQSKKCRIESMPLCGFDLSGAG